MGAAFTMGLKAAGTWSMPEDRALTWEEQNSQSYAAWLNARLAVIERAKAAGERARGDDS